MHVLIVEDEAKLAAFIQKGLSEESFSVDVVGDGDAALRMMDQSTYDLVILDIVLPGRDGFSVCRELRQRQNDVPVLMLSARGLVDDRVTGLDSGADDYLTKPFSYAELSARVRALLRRQRPAARLLKVDSLTLDPITRMVRRGDRRIDLTQKEFALLELLMRHAGQVLTRTMIAEQVWDVHWDRITNVIDVFVNHLRRKIEVGDESRLIHTVRGTGYVLRAPESEK